MTMYSSWDDARALHLVREHQHVPGALLPILHALLDEFGYVDSRCIPVVAEALNLSRAEVVGVINFYQDFRQSPPGRHVLKVCRAEACQAMGCETLFDSLRSRLAVENGATTTDGQVTLESVYCLGNCALSPAIMVDGQLHGRATADRALALVGQAPS